MNNNSCSNNMSNMDYDEIEKSEKMEQRKRKIQEYIENKKYVPMKRKDICVLSFYFIV